MGRILATFVMTMFALAAMSSTARAQDLLMGTWKLNHAKSEFHPGPPPKNHTNTYEPHGTNGLRYISDRTNAQGQAAHIEFTASFDGKDYPMKGDARDSISLRRVNPYTILATYKIGGKVTQIKAWAVSEDGKTLTILSPGVTADGEMFNNMVVFDKQ